MRLLLWDIDGTLVRIGDLGRDPFRSAIVDALGRDLEPEFHRRVRMSGKTDPQIARELLLEAEVHADDVDSHLPGVLRRLEEHLLAVEHLMQETGFATFGLDRHLDLDIGADGSDHHDREELEGLGADAVLDDLSDTEAVVSKLAPSA